ncbi:GNAT family N-acetyltransferase [Streptomyces sp. NBC_01808]|uniref:GNAT family N-acetyltransferase n=1 Tax=Streptomyces sp. NBC_01808 TaxID=2975947 RepID=UPI002DD84C6E|nr:GNAT family N-acetyltransferase [Streptomyces sp. NBC_01808]
MKLTLRPLDPVLDAPLLHTWVTHPKAAFWLMQGCTPAEVEKEYARIAADPHHDAWLGLADGTPAFLAERYDPAHRELTGVYAAEDGDVGMHFLTAPADTPVHGFTRAVITAVMEWLFADPAVRRVVVEPDARNTAVHALNEAVGFRVARRVRIPGAPGRPGKDALLSFCTREQFAASRAAAPPDPTGHLTPDHWAEATRRLLAKAIGEFTHERLLTPEPRGVGSYALRAGDAEYRFEARRYALDHWRVDPRTVTRHAPGDPPAGSAPDALRFFAELREPLGLSAEVLPVYLEEITSTLASTAYKLTGPEDADLATADFQRIEAGMTEGHPCFVANNGRLGLGASDYRTYAPETGARTRLVWLAAHRDRAAFTCAADLDYDTLLRAELSPGVLDGFAARLRALGLDPDDYLLMPAHPWQWEHKLSVTFAGEVAARRLVYLGESEDTYQPQQSIRTFFNTSAPRRHYVKTALSVLNMGFMRGLSAAYMEATPAINDWVAGLVDQDEVLRGTGLVVLRELAAVGYRHEAYEAATAPGSPYRKMLAALWRESPVPRLAEGERPATMAALLHTDRAGRPLAAALIEGSGLAPEVWLRRYLDAYLTPLLHAFYAYGLAFMPHGENVILVLDEAGTVVRALFKDIAEEVVVMDPDLPLPPAAERIRAEVPDDMQLLSIFTDVFDCFFRFLAPLLDEAGVLGEEDFWRTVAECARDYRAAVPDLADRFERHDLFAPEFALSCLNRLQLRDNRQMVDLTDPSAALQLVGTLRNPLAPYRPRTPAPG